MDISILQAKIHEVRGHKVILDFDLALLYKVETRVLNQAVKRNVERFPNDFMFQLNEEEFQNLRERNRQDTEEIDKLNYQNELKSKESSDLTAQTRTLEYDISKQLSRIDDLNKLIDTKTFDLKNKESQLIDCEGEIIQLKN